MFVEECVVKRRKKREKEKERRKEGKTVCDVKNGESSDVRAAEENRTAVEQPGSHVCSASL